MNKQIMLDLETLGTGPGSVIVAIGAVEFSLGAEGEVLRTFYERVDARSCTDLGLKMDAETVLWWMKQSKEARDEIVKRGRCLPDALNLFTTFVGVHDADVWGNGASFDNVLLRGAYEVCGMGLPWMWWNDRCFRTVKGLHPEVTLPARSGVHHNALDDARWQAEALIKLMA
jgi:hypothetical protein